MNDKKWVNETFKGGFLSTFQNILQGTYQDILRQFEGNFFRKVLKAFIFTLLTCSKLYIFWEFINKT